VRALELNGENLLASVTLTDFKALITHANPRGNEANIKNKAEGMLHTRALASVQSAISQSALAVAVDLTPILVTCNPTFSRCFISKTHNLSFSTSFQ
jgi:hypothetical protein